MTVHPNASLRLSQLPDRAVVKVTIALEPQLHALLQDYADVYQQTYGAAEPLNTLIPYMLAAFVEGDKAFVRGRRNRNAAPRPSEGDR